MNSYKTTARTQLGRIPRRAVYDTAQIHAADWNSHPNR